MSLSFSHVNCHFLQVVIDKHPVRFFVHKRPHVDFFLEVVSQWYELVVFTASMEIYGSAVADKLDNNKGILKRRYYRQVTTETLYISLFLKPFLWEIWKRQTLVTDIFQQHSPFLYLVQHCTLDSGSYIKDLSVVHDDLSSVVILDNSPGAYRSHPGKTITTRCSLHCFFAGLTCVWAVAQLVSLHDICGCVL